MVPPGFTVGSALWWLLVAWLKDSCRGRITRVPDVRFVNWMLFVSVRFLGLCGHLLLS